MFSLYSLLLFLFPVCFLFAFFFAGALGKAPSKVTDALPEHELEGATAAAVVDDDEEEDIEAMQSRLATLRS